MAFQPFEHDLRDVQPQQLAILKETHEGWYVEYKSEFVRTRDIAKSISSFANQHGGWLFFGVLENSDTLQAASFPGIPKDELSSGIESLRNASKDLIRPSVYYEHRIFPGPIPALNMPNDRSIVAVRILRGADTPYVHNDGRIYQRVGDSSNPSPVHDRATFDLLAQRGREARETLKESLDRSFTISKGEDEMCYIHLFIASDPYHMMNQRFQGQFEDFAEVMRAQEMPLENCYTGPGEYVARQTADNDQYQRLLTWHFSGRCESFVTLPVPQLPAPFYQSSDWSGYDLGAAFQEEVLKADMSGSRILDLNILATSLMAVVYRHLSLVRDSGISGPFYAKARIENSWRAIPFVDCHPFLEHVREHGLPVVQEDEMLVPHGTTLDSFVRVDELEQEVPLTMESAVGRATILIVRVLASLGVPVEVFMAFAGELINLGSKRQNYQRLLRQT